MEAIKRDIKEIKEFDPRKIEEDLLLLTEQLNKLVQSFELFSKQDTLLEKLNQMESLQEEQQNQIKSLQEQLKTNKKAKAKAECSVPGCTNQARARGLCGSHYKQFSRNTLAGYVNKGGFFTHEEKEYKAALQFEASPFQVEGTDVIIKGERFPLTELKKPATPDS